VRSHIARKIGVVGLALYAVAVAVNSATILAYLFAATRAAANGPTS
jgi:hypothetical protein